MTDEPRAISKITVRGFKSIRDEQSIQIRPLTLLAGANSSGKSSVMQPLLLLKQTLESPADPGALLLDGPNVRFTLAEQLLSRLSSGISSTEFRVGLDDSEGRSLKLRFRQRAGRGFHVTTMAFKGTSRELEWDVELHPGLNHEQILKMLPANLVKSTGQLKEQTLDRAWRVSQDRCFLSIERLLAGKLAGGPAMWKTLSPAEPFINIIESLIHIPGLRGNPQRSYPRNSPGPKFKGTFEYYTASIVAHWEGAKAKELKMLGKAMEELGLTWKVSSRAVDDTQIELKVGRLPKSAQGGGKDMVSIADVGFGVSQTLPVLVALIAARPGQMVYLEQPEIHLHPRAQRRLARILAQAAQRGVRVVAETHSALLLQEVQTLVAKGELAPDLVKLHWFERDKNGFTQITSADLDEEGAYGADWPEDFDEVALEAAKEYLDAVERGSKR